MRNIFVPSRFIIFKMFQVLLKHSVQFLELYHLFVLPSALLSLFDRTASTWREFSTALGVPFLIMDSTINMESQKL